MCFNEEYTWDSEAIDVDALAKTVKMTQVAYNDMVADGEVVSTTTYIITLDNVAVKIYIGEVEIWTA